MTITGLTPEKGRRVAHLCLRLGHDPEVVIGDRAQTADELIEDLEQWLASRIMDSPLPCPYKKPQRGIHGTIPLR